MWVGYLKQQSQVWTSLLCLAIADMSKRAANKQLKVNID